MINVDRTLLVPVALQDLIRQREASFELAVNGQRLIIKVEQRGTRRLLWSVEICDQSSVAGWNVNRYTAVPEYCHQGIAIEFYERLIQQANQAKIQVLTIFCPVANPHSLHRCLALSVSSRYYRRSARQISVTAARTTLVKMSIARWFIPLPSASQINSRR